MFDNESTTRNGMQSSISREVDRTLASSKKLFADEATRAVEERLAKRSRDTTEEAVQESVKKKHDLPIFKNKGNKGQNYHDLFNIIERAMKSLNSIKQYKKGKTLIEKQQKLIRL